MCSDVVIRAEGLGKKYVIGHQAQSERYTTLRDSLGRSFRAWGRSARDIAAGRAIVAGDETEDFWALKDVSFEIKRGDVVGVIGRNGAGKSTLLKVLSRITEPTEGRITIDGRVASLLEVGTGFHAELSGRENIFLNGAILGMAREEIRKKFDEIIAFAGVEKFLDTPVKRYSSGMYVRLAFAVAAHLEPEILIVDEVLAVGDAEFQKKCLGKMQDVAGQGRTVLFVSHNMGAVKNLCNSGMLLAAGRISSAGAVDKIIEDYSTKDRGESQFNSRKKNQATFVNHCEVVIRSETAHITLGVMSSHRMSFAFEANISDQSGIPVGLAGYGCWSSASKLTIDRGLTEFLFTFDCSSLASGQYNLKIALTEPGSTYIDQPREELSFEIPDRIRAGDQRGFALNQGHGALRIDLIGGEGKFIKEYKR